MTLRELLWMHRGHSLDAWNHTASLMALVANLVRSKGQRAWRPADFHPLLHAAPSGRVLTGPTIRAIASRLGKKTSRAHDERH